MLLRQRCDDFILILLPVDRSIRRHTILRSTIRPRRLSD